MRLPILLVVTSLGLALLAGDAYRSSVEDAVVDRQQLIEIPDLPGRFAKEHEGVQTFSLSELPQWTSDPVLVDKAASHPQSRQYNHCHPDGKEAKDAVWHQHAICNNLAGLPKDFFRLPPYLHLSGHSYVLLALTTDPDLFGEVAWLREHKSFLHVSELDEVERLGVPLSKPERLVATIEEEGLRALAEGTDLLLAEEHVLIGVSSDPTDATYRVYPRADWSSFLAKTPLVGTPLDKGDVCLAEVGAVCFTANRKSVEEQIDRASLLGGGALLLLLSALLTGMIARSRERSRDQEARLFVLQTLSHEIRTPTTSLVLSLEPLRREFDQLPEDIQPAFLRICDSVGRLQRVVEASKQYLRGEIRDQQIQFKAVEIEKASELLLGILERYDHPITLVKPDMDPKVRIDPYWVSVCTRNLIDNAMTHGRPPISVRLDQRARTLMITVEDAGDRPALTFEQMTVPFCRGDTGDGMGFGLAVVKRLVEAMGGQLRYESAPTRFTLVLYNAIITDAP